MAIRKINNKNIIMLRKNLAILVGSILMALGVNLVYEPMELVTGGVSGLAIVVKYLTRGIVDGGIPIWLFNIVCNVPLFVLSIRAKGIKFLLSSLLGMLAFSLSLIVIPVIDLGLNDYLLASILGGAVSGVCI